jgi:hypothetical protein
VRRVFGSFDLLAAHHARNLLETEGIATLLKNEILSSGAGEIPPAECQIEVWVLDDGDAARAESLLRVGTAPARPAAVWQCGGCGESLDPQFTQCWQCGRLRAA